MELLLFPLPLPGGFRKLQRLAKRKARKQEQRPFVNRPRFWHFFTRGKSPYDGTGKARPTQLLSIFFRVSFPVRIPNRPLG